MIKISWVFIWENNLKEVCYLGRVRFSEVVSLRTFPKSHEGCCQRKVVSDLWCPNPVILVLLKVLTTLLIWECHSKAKFGKWFQMLRIRGKPLSKQTLFCQSQCVPGGEEGLPGELRYCKESPSIFIDTQNCEKHGSFFRCFPSFEELFFIMLQPSTCAELLRCPRNSWHTVPSWTCCFHCLKKHRNLTSKFCLCWSVSA